MADPEDRMGRTAETANIAVLDEAAAVTARDAVNGRLDVIIWSLIAAAGVLVAIAIAAGGFRPVWHSFAAPAGACASLAAAAWFYRNIRRDDRLASALGGTAQIAAFAAIGAPLSYVATAAAWPFALQDHTLDMIDKALGLDWRALLAWTDAHSTVHSILRVAYTSVTIQISAAVIVLAFAGRLVWLRTFLLAFVIATLCAIAVAAVFPAYGVWGYYGLTPNDYQHIDPVVRDLPVPIIDGLRDGSYRLLLGIGAEGIITFPSLHTAFAVILAFAFWPVPGLRWAGLAVNAVMLASTPIDGAHYFVDIFSGLALAALAIGVARRVASQAGAAASSR
jgi:membrane-associated phospholipid phosphatase